MLHTSNFSIHAVACFVLLCSVCATILGGIAGQASLTASQADVAADAGVGLDAGAEHGGGITVVIDAGHGGEDGGTQSAKGMQEKTVNLEIAQMLNTMLGAGGTQTVMTRDEDILLYDRNVDYKGRKKVLDLAARRKIAEETEGAVFVSIHMNAFPETQYQGLQVFFSPNDPRSQMLADGIQSSTHTYLQPDNNRKIKEATSSIYLLDRLKCPAVLIECGFLSNPEEAARFETEEYRQKIAFILFCSLMDYISEQSA